MFPVPDSTPENMKDTAATGKITRSKVDVMLRACVDGPGRPPDSDTGEE